MKPEDILSTKNPELNSFESDTDYQQNLTKVVEGNVEAFEALYRRHFIGIYRYVFFKVRSSIDAEDLTSQTFMNAWRALNTFDPVKGSFSNWLYQIAHNLTASHFRSLSKKSEIKLDESFDSINKGEKLEVGPETILENQYTTETLRRAILSLGAEQQKIIYWRFIERRNHNEIATLLGKNEGAIRAMQFRALKALRQLLGEEAFFGEA